MWRIRKETIKCDDTRKTEKGEYRLFYNEYELKSCDDIKNKFKNFRLDQEYELELKEEGCQSITYLKFILHNEKEGDIYLFIIKLKVSSMTDLKYELILPFGIEKKLKKINDIRGKYSIKVKYETIFFRYLRLEEEDEKPTLEIQRSFPSVHCIIC